MEMSANNLVNLDQIAELQLQLGLEHLTPLIGRFSEEIRALIGQITTSDVNSNDLDKLIVDIHKSAGSSAALGLVGLQFQLNYMETSAKSGAPETIWSELPKLEAIWQAAKEILVDSGLLEE